MADIKPNLLSRDKALRAGHQLPLLDDLVVPGRAPSLELVEFLMTVVLPQIKTKSGKGRALKEQQQIWNEFMVLEFVEWWREQGWIKVPREVSEALEIVKKWKQLRGLPMSVSAALEIVKKWRDREHKRKVREWRAWVSRHSLDDFGKHSSKHRSCSSRQKEPRAVRAALEIVKQWSEHGRVSGEALGPPAVRRAFAVVNEWNDHGIKMARHRKFSDRQIHERVGKELHMSASAVRRARLHAKKRNKEGFYISQLFLHSPFRPS